MRLWMLNWRCSFEHHIKNMALNAKLRRMKALKSVTENDVSECQTEKYNPEFRNCEEMVALNSKLEMQLWTLNRKHGSECQTENDEGSEYRNWEPTYLNVKLRRTTLNVVIKKRWWLWTPNRKHGSKCRTENDEGSEHRNWELMSLNVKLRKTTLNVVTEKRWWL